MKFGESTWQVVATLVGGALGGFALATAWESKTDKSFWEIIAAVGTLAAVAAAVGVAHWDGIRKRSEEMQRARVAASSVTMKTAWYFAQVLHVHEKLDAARRFDCDWRDFGALAFRLQRLTPLSLDEIERLIPLPNNCAHNFAGALDRISAAQNLLCEFEQDRERVLAERRREFAGSVAFVVGEANEMLKKALDECQKASFRGLHGHRP
ncbi:hypothetical protein [Cupriavidus sp. H18C1]|uniref:hypothetical protein n=1 Tax=Cupriavidus sp. H18C1 TaxID=3241601 RepID=UPI003BB93CD2